MKNKYYTNFTGLDCYLSNQPFHVWEENDIEESHVLIFTYESQLKKEDEGLYTVENPSVIDLDFEIKSRWIEHKIKSWLYYNRDL